MSRLEELSTQQRIQHSQFVKSKITATSYKTECVRDIESKGFIKQVESVDEALSRKIPTYLDDLLSV